MSTAKKLLLLLATMIPVVYVVFFTAPLLAMLLNVLRDQDIDNGVIYSLLGHLFMMLWLLVLLAGYGALLYRSARLTPTQKTVWAVVFIVTAPFGMVVFWYFQVWRE